MYPSPCILSTDSQVTSLNFPSHPQISSFFKVSRIYNIPIYMVKNCFKNYNTKCWWGCGKVDHLSVAGRNIKCFPEWLYPVVLSFSVLCLKLYCYTLESFCGRQYKKCTGFLYVGIVVSNSHSISSQSITCSVASWLSLSHSFIFSSNGTAYKSPSFQMPSLGNKNLQGAKGRAVPKRCSFFILVTKVEKAIEN